VGTLGGITTTIPSFPTSGGVTPFTQVHGGSVSVGSGVPLSSTLNTGLSLATFVGFFLDLLLALFVLSIIGVFVIIVVANRADPDPTGRRPQAVYYFAVSFVTLAVTVVASAVVVSGIDALVGNHSNAVTNAAARAILVGVLAVLMAGVLLTIHLRRGLDLVRQDTQAPAPSKRVGQSYVASVAFVSVVSLLFLFIFSVYLIFALVAPGVFGSLGNQGNSAHVLVVAVYLWIVAWVVLETHRRLVSPELDILGRRRNADSHTTPTSQQD
jgi:uncharacterized membrane protein